MRTVELGEESRVEGGARLPGVLFGRVALPGGEVLDRAAALAARDDAFYFPRLLAHFLRFPLYWLGSAGLSGLYGN